MKKELELVAPVLEYLHRFCNELEKGEVEAAVDRMIASVRGLWPDVPPIQLRKDPYVHLYPELTASQDLLIILCSVAFVADSQSAGSHPKPSLAWCRANLLGDLERFKESCARDHPDIMRGR